MKVQRKSQRRELSVRDYSDKFMKKRRKFIPSRALFAENGDFRATATWQFRDEKWRCCSASKHLKWMEDMTDVNRARNLLRIKGFTARWIVPELARTPIEPPFKL